MANRKIILYQNHFTDFYDEQSEAVQEKIDYRLTQIRTEDRLPTTVFKHLENTDGLYEIRVELGNNIFRIFCCFDEGALVVLFNAFQKKTQKTPPREIAKAEKLKKEYFKTKSYGK